MSKFDGSMSCKKPSMKATFFCNISSMKSFKNANTKQGDWEKYVMFFYVVGNDSNFIKLSNYVCLYEKSLIDWPRVVVWLSEQLSSYMAKLIKFITFILEHLLSHLSDFLFDLIFFGNLVISFLHVFLELLAHCNVSSEPFIFWKWSECWSFWRIVTEKLVQESFEWVWVKSCWFFLFVKCPELCIVSISD